MATFSPWGQRARARVPALAILRASIPAPWSGSAGVPERRSSRTASLTAGTESPVLARASRKA